MVLWANGKTNNPAKINLAYIFLQDYIYLFNKTLEFDKMLLRE